MFPECLIQIDVQDVQFSVCLLLWLATLAFTFPAIISTRQVRLICIFKSSFCRNSVVWFLSSYTAQKMKFSIKDFFSKCDQIRSFLKLHFLCSVNCECDVYLPFDHSLVYSHSKMFPLFFSIILSLV